MSLSVQKMNRRILKAESEGVILPKHSLGLKYGTMSSETKEAENDCKMVKYRYDSCSLSKTAQGNRVYLQGALYFVFKECAQCLEGLGL